MFLLADGKPYVLFTTFWTCTHVRCYATSGLGVGVGCNNIFELEHMSMLRNIWACTHVRCYATSGLAHMFDATQHLGLHTCSMLRNIWACIHVRCYATSGLAHMFDATQHLGLHTWLLLRNTMGWGGVGGGWGVGGVGMMMFFGLAHMLDATELLMFFRACTHLGLPRKRKAPVWLRWLHCCAWTYDCCLRRYIIY